MRFSWLIRVNTLWACSHCAHPYIDPAHTIIGLIPDPGIVGDNGQVSQTGDGGAGLIAAKVSFADPEMGLIGIAAVRVCAHEFLERCDSVCIVPGGKIAQAHLVGSLFDPGVLGKEKNKAFIFTDGQRKSSAGIKALGILELDVRIHAYGLPCLSRAWGTPKRDEKEHGDGC